VTALATLAGVHRGWAWVVIGGNAVAGLWALGAHRWAQLRTPGLWWFTGAVEVAVFAQVILGVAMVAGKSVRPDLKFHMLYGFSTIVAVGILYSYRQQLRHRIYLLYGFGGLFLMGLGIRAWQVGPR
jgi:hypothetical protein